MAFRTRALSAEPLDNGKSEARGEHRGMYVREKRQTNFDFFGEMIAIANEAGQSRSVGKTPRVLRL